LVRPPLACRPALGEDPERSKDVGEKVLLHSFRLVQIYASYYPPAVRALPLQRSLGEFGREIGKNLFVNLGALNDWQYELAARGPPNNTCVVVMTILESLPSVLDKYLTVYVRSGSAIAH
jgi:hypothetical protein